MPIRKLTGTLLFVQVQTPVECYTKEKGHEWKASICVDEDTADAWNEDYTKQPATVVKTSEFEGKYKVPAPFPDAKKQYVITLRKNTKLGNGEDVPEIYQPKVLLPQDDGSHKDVTSELLVGNGSKGSISVDLWETRSGNNVARLKNILVTDLVKYEKKEGEGSAYVPGSEFGDAPKKPASKPAKTRAKVEAEQEEDAPF